MPRYSAAFRRQLARKAAQPAAKPAPRLPTGSALEEALALQIRLARLPPPVRELAFAKPRRWRFDYAWPDLRLALEVDGGTWSNGRHTRAAGFERDCEKLNAAAALGWRVLRVTGAMIHDGRALMAIAAALSAR